MNSSDDGLDMFIAKLASILYHLDYQSVSTRTSSCLLDQLASEETLLQVHGSAMQPSDAESYLALVEMLRSALNNYRSQY